MKKLLSILLAALCALLPLAALAETTTTLKTTVPSEHTITIVCGEHGSVKINGKTYKGTFTIQVPRLGDMTIRANPDDGYGLWKIEAADMDGVTIDGRKITLSSVHSDNTLIIRFYKLPDTENDEPTDAEQLHDGYLGTGTGFHLLHIVFDGDYAPEDYELLNIRTEDEELPNSVLVSALFDEDEKAARRSLILTAAQLTKLRQTQETERLIFENGDAMVRMDMADLLDGDMRKLMALILSGEETITADTLSRDWSQMEDSILTPAQLARIKVETRITPLELADGAAYEISVWLRWGDRELDVTGMIPSLTVCMKVDGLVTEENRESFTEDYALVRLAPASGGTVNAQTETVQIPCALEALPEELPKQQKDAAERYIVIVADKANEAPNVTYTANAPLPRYRHKVLAGGYAGEGTYTIMEIQ